MAEQGPILLEEGDIVTLEGDPRMWRCTLGGGRVRLIELSSAERERIKPTSEAEVKRG